MFIVNNAHLLLRPGNHLPRMEPHSVVRGEGCGPGVLLLLRMGALGFVGSLFISEFKT